MGNLTINSRPMLSSQTNRGAIALAIINKYVQELGFHPIEGWQEVDSATAFQIITDLLTNDLAYGVTLMSDSQAKNLTNLLMSQFSGSCRFFTNGDRHLLTSDDARVSRNTSWIPISDAIFDAGIIFICADSIGIFWVVEDD